MNFNSFNYIIQHSQSYKIVLFNIVNLAKTKFHLQKFLDQKNSNFVIEKHSLSDEKNHDLLYSASPKGVQFIE